uniref:Tetraspanin n=1 Tax=Amphiprion percula TaxID=161767 RepID=A0A3P8T797_AMPPE
MIKFICILIVIIILEILTGAVFYIFRSKVRHLNPTCCGADSYTDWSKSVGWENHDAVPDSCCMVKTEGCGQDKGCISAIKLFLVKNLLWVGAVCITLGVTEVNNITLQCCFVKCAAP